MSAEIQTGPFVHRVNDQWTRGASRSGSYLIVVAQAYQARGIRDTALNGIAILNRENRRVVLDLHLRVPAGTQVPTPEQRREAHRLLTLDDVAFARFCVMHWRFRGVVAAPNLVKLTARPRRTLPEILAQDLSYNDAGKAEFHREATRLLRLIAIQGLGLQRSQYELHSNLAGPAVSGEVTLHTEQCYLQVTQCSLGRQHDVLYRTCRGLRDYCGGANHFAPAEALLDTKQFANRLQQVLVPTQARHAHARARRVP